MKPSVILLLPLILATNPALAADEAENLKGLKQLKVLPANLHPTAREVGLASDALELQVRSGLRRDFPRLALHQNSHSYVHVRVTLLKGEASPDQEPSCITLLELEVHRPGTILNDELRPEVALTMVGVWEKSVLLSGLCTGAQAAVEAGLENLLQALAVDYRAANP
jgi:hypothetical protein